MGHGISLPVPVRGRGLSGVDSGPPAPPCRTGPAAVVPTRTAPPAQNAESCSPGRSGRITASHCERSRSRLEKKRDDRLMILFYFVMAITKYVAPYRWLIGVLLFGVAVEAAFETGLRYSLKYV